jgi:hypothetical protein
VAVGYGESGQSNRIERLTEKATADPTAPDRIGDALEHARRPGRSHVLDEAPGSARRHPAGDAERRRAGIGHRAEHAGRHDYVEGLRFEIGPLGIG